jgi:hypothetical protein
MVSAYKQTTMKYKNIRQILRQQQFYNGKSSQANETMKQA